MAEKLGSNFDTLDFAYFCIGVGEYLRDHDVDPDHWDGELGFVSACIEYARALDVPVPEVFDGVFLYDVARPTGYAVAEQLHAGAMHASRPTHAAVRAQVAKLIATPLVGSDPGPVAEAMEGRSYR